MALSNDTFSAEVLAQYRWFCSKFSNIFSYICQSFLSNTASTLLIKHHKRHFTVKRFQLFLPFIIGNIKKYLIMTLRKHSSLKDFCCKFNQSIDQYDLWSFYFFYRSEEAKSSNITEIVLSSFSALLVVMILILSFVTWKKLKKRRTNNSEKIRSIGDDACDI